MKKLLLLFGIILIPIGCFQKKQENDRKLLEEIVVEYQASDTPYMLYGYNKEIYRRYNYQYRDSSYHFVERIDEMHEIDCFINEYGDTVMFRYIDFTNYPRRED